MNLTHDEKARPRQAWSRQVKAGQGPEIVNAQNSPGIPPSALRNPHFAALSQNIKIAKQTHSKNEVSANDDNGKVRKSQNEKTQNKPNKGDCVTATMGTKRCSHGLFRLFLAIGFVFRPDFIRVNPTKSE